MVGRTLGQYRVESKLGDGGMGVVYEATDTRLGRKVAIKLLHPSVVQDAERMARFEREARVLASLNHANIAAIHGLEEADGTTFLVLEYVPGDTLAERLARGPLPLKEALDDLPADRRRDRGGPREGHRPPRPEAGQHQDHARRHRSRCWTSGWRRRSTASSPLDSLASRPRPPRPR